jgi:hypothetical protein
LNEALRYKRELASSIPDEVTAFFYDNLSSRTMTLMSIQES